MYYNQRFDTNHNACCNKDFDQSYDFNQDYNQKFDNDYDKKHCCVKRVEETFYCCPSYYNEEKEDCKKEDERKCWEGTFKFCESQRQKENHDNCKYNSERKNQSCCRTHNRCCGLCGLFRRW